MADRRTTLAVAAAVVVAVAVIGLVLAFGIRRLPVFRAASADPALEAPGRIAYLSADADEPCVRVVPADGGSPQTLRCAGSDAGLRWIDTVAWTPDGKVLLGASTDVGDSVVLVVDASSGEVLDRVVRPPGELLPGSWQDPRAARVREDGAELLIGGDDGSPRVAVRSPQGAVRTVLSVEGPRDYRFADAQWSPDGEWVAVVDGEERLLLVDAAGDAEPRLLAEDVEPRDGAVAWFVAGEESGTIDPADLAADP